jgi:hypothetical protein
LVRIVTQRIAVATDCRGLSGGRRYLKTSRIHKERTKREARTAHNARDETRFFDARKANKMTSRLRKRQIIPEDTSIRATLTDPKIVHGQFGRQVEVVVLVTEGGENNEYKGTTFKTWFSFGKDKDTGEEYIGYGGALYQLLSIVAPNLDDVLEDDDLSDREYEKFVKKTIKGLDELDIVARVGVKVGKKDPSKQNNVLQPGTFGPYQDPEEGFENIEISGNEAEEKAPF